MVVGAIAILSPCVWGQSASAPAGGGAAATLPAASDAKPKIAVDEQVKDCGTIYAGEPIKHAFKISNVGKADLHITKVLPGCGCTVTGKYPEVLKPGESGEFPFTVNTTYFRGPFAKSPMIYSDDPDSPQTRLTIKGEAKRQVDVNPPSVFFSAIGGSEPQERIVKITNNAEQPLELTLEPPADPSIFKFELTPKAPGKEYELKVSAVPPWGDPGSKRVRVLLKTNLEKEKEIPIFVSANLPVRLEVLPPVVRVIRQQTPQDVKAIFPPPTTGPAATPPTRKIVVRFNNNGEKPVKVLEATTDDPQSISVSFKEYQPGKLFLITLEMAIDYVPPATGRKLTIKTDDAEKPVIVVPITGQTIPSVTPSTTPPTTPQTTRPATQPAQVQKQLRPAETMIGQDIPAFSAEIGDGKKISKDDLGGAVAVLDFFSPKCGFCKKQMPLVEQVRKELEDRGVRFVYVAQTMGKTKVTKDEVAKMFEQIKVSGDVSLDPDNELGKMFKATSFPTMVLLDRKGKIAAVNVGFRPDLPDRTKKQIEAILAGKPIPTDLLPPKDAKPPAAAQTPRINPTEELVGKAIPAFSGTTEGGKPIAQDNLGAGIVVLDVFSPKCGFCRKQMPVVEAIRKEYESKGVRFVYLAQTMGQAKVTKEDAGKMMEQINVTGELLMDPDNKIGGEAFKARGYPTLVILEKGGKVAAVSVGARPDLSERTKKQLDAVLAGKPIPADLLPAKVATTK